MGTNFKRQSNGTDGVSQGTLWQNQSKSEFSDALLQERWRDWNLPLSTDFSATQFESHQSHAC